MKDSYTLWAAATEVAASQVSNDTADSNRTKSGVRCRPCAKLEPALGLRSLMASCSQWAATTSPPLLSAAPKATTEPHGKPNHKCKLHGVDWDSPYTKGICMRPEAKANSPWVQLYIVAWSDTDHQACGRLRQAFNWHGRSSDWLCTARLPKLPLRRPLLVRDPPQQASLSLLPQPLPQYWW